MSLRYLTLADNVCFEGDEFGARMETEGEVVFNTSMTGYVAALTDPSYTGQIIVFTYPMVGNYGVPLSEMESHRICVRGAVITTGASAAFHPAAVEDFEAWLKRNNIPAICNADTRSIVKHIRTYGTLHGRISSTQRPPSAEDHPTEELLKEASASKIQICPGTGPTILVIDTGCKESIIQHLHKRDAKVIRAPWHSPWEQFLTVADGVLLSNGPGDPSQCDFLVERIAKILRDDIPVFGICFGHQLLARAAGFDTYKLKFGHRSSNQPVKDLISNRCYLTSQNHSYAVAQNDTLREWRPWFVNLNDLSNEGIRHVSKPHFSVQFHPEAAPGPHDTTYLFSYFIQLAKKHRITRRAFSLPEGVHDTHAVS